MAPLPNDFKFDEAAFTHALKQTFGTQWQKEYDYRLDYLMSDIAKKPSKISYEEYKASERNTRQMLDKAVSAHADLTLGKIVVQVEWPETVSDPKKANALLKQYLSRALPPEALAISDTATGKDIERMVQDAKTTATIKLYDHMVFTSRDKADYDFAAGQRHNLKAMADHLPQAEKTELLALQQKALEAAGKRDAALKGLDDKISAISRNMAAVMSARGLEEYGKEYSQTPDTKYHATGQKFLDAAKEQKIVHDAMKKIEPLLVKGGQAAGLSSDDIKLALFRSRINQKVEYHMGDLNTGKSRNLPFDLPPITKEKPPEKQATLPPAPKGESKLGALTPASPFTQPPAAAEQRDR